MIRGPRSIKTSGRNRKSKKGSVFHNQRIRFAARKVMAITVSEQSLRRAITRPSPDRHLHCPVFPSMALRAWFHVLRKITDFSYCGTVCPPEQLPEHLLFGYGNVHNHHLFWNDLQEIPATITQVRDELLIPAALGRKRKAPRCFNASHFGCLMS